MAQLIPCTNCQKPLGPEVLTAPKMGKCLNCGADLHVDAFPALLKVREKRSLEDSFIFDNEAGCFYHPHKKAVIPCSACGRFLCKLCDLEIDNRHICPSCLEKGQRTRKIKNLENHRTLYDSLALSLSILPLLFFWVTIITAPATLYITIRYWKAPTSIVGRTKFRFILAALFAAAEITGWIMFFVALGDPAA